MAKGYQSTSRASSTKESLFSTKNRATAAKSTLMEMFISEVSPKTKNMGRDLSFGSASAKISSKNKLNNTTEIGGAGFPMATANITKLMVI